MKYLTRILYTAVSLISLIAGIYGAEALPPTTPERGEGSAAAEGGAAVYPTPGEKVAQRQRAVFVRDRFVEVFGEEAVDALEINWDVLADTRTPFEDAIKRHNVHRISRFMERYFRSRIREEKFSSLFGDVVDIKSAMDTVPENRLHEHARRYFSRLFPESEITFRSKSGGDQLGSIVIVTHPDGSTVKYYVKTHSAGLKVSHSSAADELNPIELLVYKILEGFGIGCETHFFGRDKENCFIATRDANYEGTFTEYHTIKNDEAARVPVWGRLTTALTERAHINEANHEIIETAIGEDPIAQNFMRQMSLLDLLARLMLLTDLQTNGHNFGFTRREGELPALRVIDFRLHDAPDFRITGENYRGFLVGNGFFSYYSADKAVCYALRNRPKEIRTVLAREIFETSLREWEPVIEEAKRQTIAALREAGLLTEDMERDLNTHTDILKANFALFDRLLHEGEGE